MRPRGILRLLSVFAAPPRLADVVHRQQRSPLFVLDDQPALSQMRFHRLETKISVGMSRRDPEHGANP